MPSDDFGPTGTDTLSSLKFLVEIAGYRRLAILGLLMLGSSLTEGIGLLLLVPLTQAVSGETDQILGGWLVGIGIGPLLAGFVTLICLRALLVYVTGDQQTVLGMVTTQRLRTICQRAIARAEWRWLATQSSSHHAAMIMGMSERIGRLTEQALLILAGGLTLTALLVSALYISWSLTLLALLLGVAVATPVFLLRMRESREGVIYTQRYTHLQRLVSEGIAHLRAARIAGAIRAVEREFDNAAESLMVVERQYQRKVAQIGLVLQATAAITLAGIVYIGLEIMEVPLSVLVPVLAIFARLVPTIAGVQSGVRAWMFCKPALRDLLGTTAAARAMAEPADTGHTPPHMRQSIATRSLTVRFEGRPRAILEGLDIEIRAGSIVAVTGPSGTGKSTLADVLSGLITPDEGAVLVDGEPLSSEDRVAWRRRVAYVEQSPYLFDAAVSANLAWGRADVSRERLERALHAASAQFVLDFPEGLDTIVGETGRQLSGGEKQRIALARAMLHEPDLLILDETTSALDPDNERVIQESIRNLRGRCTILILGHRAAMTELADDIIDLGAINDARPR